MFLIQYYDNNSCERTTLEYTTEKETQEKLVELAINIDVALDIHVYEATRIIWTLRAEIKTKDKGDE